MQSTLLNYVLELGAGVLQRLGRVDNGLFQAAELQAQDVSRALVIIAENLVGAGAALDIWAWELLLVLWEVFPDDLDNLLVGEIAGHDEEALVSSLGHLDSLDVCQGKVADVDPQEDASLGDLILKLAKHGITDALVGSVEGVQRVQIVHDGTEDQRRIHSSDCEVWLLLLHKLPSSTLSKRLAGSVTIGGVLESLLVCQGRPISLGVGVLGPKPLTSVDHGSEGGCYNHTLNGGRAGLDGLENTGCTNDCGIQELLLDIGDVEMEGACSVHDGLERRVGNDGLVKRTLLCNILDNGKVKL